MDIKLLKKIVIICLIGAIAHAIFGPIGLAIVALAVILKETKSVDS